MSIYKSAINKPVTTILVFVGVMVMGLFSLQQLPIDQFPEIEPPFMTVTTTYPGANASDIETNVTEVLENSLNSIDGLDIMSSTSKDNMSVIILEMDWETDIDEAINDVRSSIDMVRDYLPEGCSTPLIFKFSTSSMPIIQYAVTAKESFAGLDKILNDVVMPQLNRVNGIGNISLAGSPERYVYVEIDQTKLDSYGIPLESVGNAISANNLDLSSGTIKMGKEQYQLQVRSEYDESEEIGDIVVTTTQTGQQIFVKDIAVVKDTIKDLTLDEKFNMEDGVRIIITKQSGANTAQICDDVKVEMERIVKTLPADIDINIIWDSSEDIKNSVNSLKDSIFWALLFVVLVVFFFLGNWRATIIIAITIPISLIVTFIYLLAVGSSLNIISLSSLTVAIGMVVDDAIVVLENISKHIDRGSNPREAAIYATNEVWISVIATTLVIVAVFVPLTFLTGMAGIMLEELGWIVTIVVVTSTVIAITLTPMLCSKLLKARKVSVDEKGKLIEHIPNRGWYDRIVVGTLDKIDNLYARTLSFVLNHKTISLLVAVVIFAASMIPMVKGYIGSDFMQQTDNGQLTASVELQMGTRIDETLKTARKLEERFLQIAPEIEVISTSAGSNDEDGISAVFSSTSNNTISMTIITSKKDKRERTIWEIAEVLRQEMTVYPEIVDFQCNVSSGMRAGGTGTVDVEIYGYDFSETSLSAEEVKNTIINKVPNARNLTVSREDERPELMIKVDKEKVALHGLTSSTISSYVRNRVGGMPTGFLRQDGDEYNIVVRLQEENRNSISDIRELSIPLPQGGYVKLEEIAQVEEYWGPPTIERKSRQRIVTVSATPYGISMGEMAVQIEEALSEVRFPADITYRIAGEYEDQEETFADMGLLLMLIILLVYIVMASQFESFAKPAIIMMSVPFAFTGVIMALWITGTSLDMIGALGAIMLVGIVVKNGIVLVDYINLMRDRGNSLYEAISLSGASRLRPVLMTAMTTLLGMLPMAMSNGEGAEMWRPMGIVVIGGILVSTFVTLFVVPIMYAVLSKSGERNKEGKNREKFIFMKLSTKEE